MKVVAAGSAEPSLKPLDYKRSALGFKQISMDIDVILFINTVFGVYLVSSEAIYRNMTIPEGVAHIEQHYTADELKNITSFSDLHDLRDANMTLPFPDDCGKSGWLEFANVVIEAFDLKLQKDAVEETR